MNKWPAVRTLLEHCDKSGHDNLGYIHFIPKELVDDAKEEYRQYLRGCKEQAGSVH